MPRWYDSDKGKVEGRPRLGYPTRHKRGTIFLGAYKLLLTIGQRLCSHRRDPYIINKEGCGVALGDLLMVCLSAIEGIIMCYASVAVPKP